MSLGLLAALLLVVGGCSGPDKPVRPEFPKELNPAITSSDEPLSLQDDYWTRCLGPYLSPEELHQYWIEPHDKRFVSYGERWLEFSLREDLLARRRWELSSEQVNEFRSQPDFESGKRTLEGFGSKSE